MRSRSHGRPLARCSASETGWNCADTHTSGSCTCGQLLNGKSTSRYTPANGTAAFAVLGQKFQAAARTVGQDQDKHPGQRHG